MRKTRANLTAEQVNRVSLGQRTVGKDKKSLPGLVSILDEDILSKLTDEDATLRLMKTAINNKDYEGFTKIDPYINSFWDSAAVIDDCIIFDDRIAIPSCHQRAVLTHFHRSHPSQEAKVDTA